MNSAINLDSNPFKRSAASRELRHVRRMLNRRGGAVSFGGTPHGLTRRALEAAGYRVAVKETSWTGLSSHQSAYTGTSV